MKKAGPSLRREIPPLKRCDDCSGTGEVKGLFHEMECYTCNATGVLHKETGEQVDHKLVLKAMRTVITKQRKEIARLKAKLPKDDDHDPYKGMSDRLGGKFRMD